MWSAVVAIALAVRPEEQAQWDRVANVLAETDGFEADATKALNAAQEAELLGFAKANWLLDGRVLAGPHPSVVFGNGDARNPVLVQALLRLGVRAFVNLVPPYEEAFLGLDEYWKYFPEDNQAEVIHKFAVGEGTSPVLDGMCPDIPKDNEEKVLERTAACARYVLAREGVTYVHCLGGCGRTATVSAAIRALSTHEGSDSVLNTVQELAKERRKSPSRCPQTEEQFSIAKLAIRANAKAFEEGVAGDPLLQSARVNGNAWFRRAVRATAADPARTTEAVSNAAREFTWTAANEAAAEAVVLEAIRHFKNNPGLHENYSSKLVDANWKQVRVESAGVRHALAATASA